MKYDLLLWGATGYTGQFAGEYLARHYPPSKKTITWAIGGRNQSKLEQVKSDLMAIDQSCTEVGVLVADVKSQQEIDRVVASARVVLATAGPFEEFGTSVVDACVRLGVHYCDITGETTWVHGLIKKYHDEAAAKNVFIVPFCGFDSIPSDIGTFMMVDYIRNTLKREPNKVEFVVKFQARGKAGMAGGTFRSALFALENKENQKKVSDPYLLSPAGSPKPKSPSDFLFARFHRQLHKWIGFFPMSPINTRVVRRSSALLQYGPNFTYSEYLEYPNPLASILALLGLGLLMFIVQFSFVRKFLKARLPPPGSGPIKEELKKLRFCGSYYAETIPKGNEKPIEVTGRLQSEMDPGYGETGKMLVESAICLATQMDQILEQGSKGGVLTPASSMGGLLLERLRKARMVMEVNQVGDS